MNQMKMHFIDNELFDEKLFEAELLKQEENTLELFKTALKNSTEVFLDPACLIVR